MPTLVIKSVPAKLHARLKRVAADNRRSLTQETLHLLENALAARETRPPAASLSGPAYWSTRPLQPNFAAAKAAGAFVDRRDSAAAISAEREER